MITSGGGIVAEGVESHIIPGAVPKDIGPI